MFATLESFSIFYFICLALIILAIVFEDKLTAFVVKHEKKHAKKKTTIKEVRRNENRGAEKCA